MQIKSFFQLYIYLSVFHYFLKDLTKKNIFLLKNVVCEFLYILFNLTKFEKIYMAL